MKFDLEALETLTDEELAELAEDVLNQTIKVLRNLAVVLLPQVPFSVARHQFYVKLLIKLTDSVQNLPSYLKESYADGLKRELNKAISIQLDYFQAYPSLISDLHAYSLVNAFMEKGVIVKGK